jgi:hypothetical protein
MIISEINKLIAWLSDEERNHTLGDLYEHRCILFIAMVNVMREL